MHLCAEQYVQPLHCILEVPAAARSALYQQQYTMQPACEHVTARVNAVAGQHINRLLPMGDAVLCALQLSGLGASFATGPAETLEQELHTITLSTSA